MKMKVVKGVKVLSVAFKCPPWKVTAERLWRTR